jgi:site-specific DNA-methyltransferase (adenine-specific)
MIITADCVETMADMEADSIDAIVCDPPYGIGFMGKEWDGHGDGRSWATMGGLTGRDNTTHSERGGAMHAGKYDLRLPAMHGFQTWCEAWATEAYRILKPGAHLLAFGGTRTYHRLACAVEDAGFEIRDSLLWLYGSGFPKSLDVSKAIDKAAGAEPDRITDNESGSLGGFGDAGWNATPRQLHYDEPQTPDAQRWQGWGTALKPSHEPIVVARKPLSGTVAANVLAHGTGALNIDGCRVEGDGHLRWSEPRDMGYHGGTDSNGTAEVNTSGRWPSNVILSPESAAELDEQSGELNSPATYTRTAHAEGEWLHAAKPAGSEQLGYGDTGGASRFFYCAKASRAERNAGTKRNVHPTVKPLALMRWLVRLVTPPGGTVLDPFTGSGTTGAAAALEGFDFIGIEREPEYALIAEARVAFWARYPGADVDAVLESDAQAREIEASGQLGLFA